MEFDWLNTIQAGKKLPTVQKKKRQNAGELRGKFAISSIKFQVSLFSVGLDNTVRIHDKIQVVYKEMACDGAKSNEAKWNLIGRIQFRHVKNSLLFMYVMECKLLGVCVVGKRRKSR